MPLLRAATLVALLTSAALAQTDPLYAAWNSSLITVPAGAPTPKASDPGQWNLRAIGVDRAWAITTGSPTVTVAVIDYPFRLSHPDLQGALWVNTDEIPNNGVDDDNNTYVDDVNGWDFYRNRNTPFVTATGPFYEHGTPVAGIIAARRGNSAGIAGIAGGTASAPGVKYMFLVWRNASNYGFNVDQQLTRAVDYAVANGADIIQMSFSVSNTPGFYDAIDRARAAGVVLITGTGNYDPYVPDTRPDDDYQEASVANCETVSVYPAALSGVLAVGATLTDGKRWAGSCPAPLGAEPIVMAPGGERIIPTTGSDGNYALFNGTSAAAPHVSGVAALLLSVNPTLTPVQVYTALRSTANATGCPISSTLSPARQCGAGLIDAHAALLYVIRNHGAVVAHGSTWSPGNVTLSFNPGQRVTVNGTLNATGTTFNASTPASGWGGIRYNTNSAGTLDGVTIERVKGVGADAAAVRVENASVTIKFAHIRNSVVGSSLHGVYAYGDGSLTLRDNQIYGLTGTGLVRVYGGMALTLERNLIFTNAKHGIEIVYANGGQYSQNQVGGDGGLANGQRGMLASTVVSNSANLYGQNQIINNGVAGLDATESSYIWGANAGNIFRDSGTQDPRYTVDGEGPDARASSYATVDVPYSWWGRPVSTSSPPDVTTCASTYTTCQASPWLYDGYVYWSPGLSAPPSARVAASPALPSTEVQTPEGLLRGAREAISRGAGVEALAALQSVLLPRRASASERSALAETARLCGDADAGASALGLLDDVAAEPGPSLRAWWARHNQVVCHLRAGRKTDGLAAAEALAAGPVPASVRSEADWVAAEVARFGRSVAFHEHLSAGRPEAALPYLIALLEGWGDDEATTRAAEIWESVTGTPPPTAPQARRAPSGLESANLEAQGVRLGAPQPNPARGESTISFDLAQAASVRLVVLDALGREVAVLAEGPREAGPHTARFDGHALAPGVYLARLHTEVAEGMPVVLTRRLTVAR